MAKKWSGIQVKNSWSTLLFENAHLFCLL